MPPFPIHFVPKADIAIYRAGAYVRSFPGGATAATRGTALLTARTAAASGDTIVVGPGTYTITTGQLLKNGVNWHIENGATITSTKDAYGGLFDDSATWGANAAVTCKISGMGAFVRTAPGTGVYPGDANACVIISNTSSNVSIQCKSITESSINATSNCAIRHAGGTLHVACDLIYSNQGVGVWWSDGDEYINADVIQTARSSFYSSANDSGTEQFPTGWISGDAWITANKMEVFDTSGGYSGVVYATGVNGARVWVRAMEMEQKGDGPVIVVNGNFVYIDTLKAHTTFAGTSLFGTQSIRQAGGGLWLNAQKVVGGQDGAIQFMSGDAAYYDILNLEDNGTSTDPLVYCEDAGNETAVALNLRCETITKAANGTAVKVSDPLTTLNLLAGKITTQASQYDLEQSAGTLNVAAGVEFDRAKTSGTITWLGSQSVFRALNSVAAVTLTDGATPALNAALGKVFRLTAAGNRTIAVPSNPTDGQAIIIEHTASGGSRTLALNTGTGGFAFTTDVTALTATSSGVTDRIGCIYNLAENKWRVVAYNKGA